MRFTARVEVRLRPGIADPEGATIERALPALGFNDVHAVRAGRSFRFEVDAGDETEARQRVESLAHRLLANPVIEDAELELTPAAASAAAPPETQSAAPGSSPTPQR
ncbi:MAG: phosphoribosylformylglycinamidine synthase subunit PurS [Solirubrobacteraceae bacterium]